jgi:hypothetical protein
MRKSDGDETILKSASISSLLFDDAVSSLLLGMCRWWLSDRFSGLFLRTRKVPEYVDRSSSSPLLSANDEALDCNKELSLSDFLDSSLDDAVLDRCRSLLSEADALRPTPPETLLLLLDRLLDLDLRILDTVE